MRPAHRLERAPGQHATPASLALRVARTALAAAPEAELWLDPACGEGALLVAVLEAWLERASTSARRELRLHGIDVDAQALVIARARIDERIEAARRGGSSARVALTLEHADALAPRQHWPTHAAIVANPPWGSYSGRGRLARAESSDAAERGWPSLHGRFIERIADHGARGRMPAIVLMPASWCELERYAESRARVDAHAALTRASEELGESVFPGVTGATTLVTLLPRGGHAQDAEAAALKSRPADDAVLRALLTALEPLPHWPAECFGDVGVHTGNAAAELLVHGADRRTPADGANLREGRDLSEYRLAAPRIRLREDVEPRANRRFRIGTHARSWRVLLRQTANRPIAAVHEPATWFRNSLLACRPPDGVDADAAVALLNGPVATVLHALSFADARQRSFPQVKIAHLRAQRFPFATRDRAPRLHDELATRARALRERSDEPANGGWRDDLETLAACALQAFELPAALHGEVRRVCMRARARGAHALSES